MRILLINPNSTKAMTASIAANARSCAPRDWEILPVTNASAPPAIQGPEDGEAAIPGVLEIIAARPDADGIIIACFDDTGLAEARLQSAVPVLGIGQAAFHMAALRAGSFDVVTTLQVSVPVIEENISAMGFAGSCREVRASGVPVLDLEFEPQRAAERVIASLRQSSPEVAATVLGCAGMGAILPLLPEDLRRRSVDPVFAAITLMRAVLAR